MALHKNLTGLDIHETKVTAVAGSPVTLSTTSSAAGVVVYNNVNTAKPLLYVSKSTTNGDYVPAATGPINYYTYANAAARTGASGFISEDLGKVALQSDNSTFWVLTATTPTWVELSNSSVAAGTLAVSTKTTTYTATSTDGLLNGDATSASFTITLPSAAANDGKVFYFKKTDSSANTVTIARAGSDTIDGATSYVLSSQYESITMVGDATATAWRLV